MFKEPEYIFYPMTPLYCFSNKQAFVMLKRDLKRVEELKKTRAITEKKE